MYNKEWSKNWRENNKERIKAYRQKYQDKARLKQKEWRERNKDKIIKHDKEWYKTHKNYYKENNKKWHQNNKEYLRLKKKEYRRNNQDKLKITRKKYIQNNKDKIRLKDKEHYEKNPKMHLKSKIKQLKKNAIPFKLTHYEYGRALMIWSKIIKKQNNSMCQICGSIHELDAHHIFEKRYYPQLSLNESNGITLCTTCHNQAHGKKLVKQTFYASKYSTNQCN